MLHNQDQIRFEILTHLEGVMREAKNENMQRQNIHQIQHALRKLGYEEEDISSEVTYLKDRGYIKSKTITIKHTPINFGRYASNRSSASRIQSYKQEDYCISAGGRDHLNGQSEQFKKRSVGFVNIGAIYNGGAIAIGDGSQATAYVFKDHIDLYKALGEMKDGILNSNDLDDTTKAEATADVETIRSQVSKPTPNKGIVKMAWEGLQGLVKIESIIKLFATVSTLIKPFL